MTLDLLQELAEVPSHVSRRNREKRSSDFETTSWPAARGTSTRASLEKSWPRFPPRQHELDQADVDALVERFRQRLALDDTGTTATLIPFGGIVSEINTINSPWLPDTARTAELLHFC
jgi:hypothetical protein